MAKEEMKYEQAVRELEQIVERMENDELDIDLAGRMHTYGPDAVVTLTNNGWRVEYRKAKPTERRLIGVVSDLVEALKGNSPESEVTFDSRGWMNLA